jgi:hypothetical protein
LCVWSCTDASRVWHTAGYCNYRKALLWRLGVGVGRVSYRHTTYRVSVVLSGSRWTWCYWQRVSVPACLPHPVAPTKELSLRCVWMPACLPHPVAPTKELSLRCVWMPACLPHPVAPTKELSLRCVWMPACLGKGPRTCCLCAFAIACA